LPFPRDRGEVEAAADAPERRVDAPRRKRARGIAGAEPFPSVKPRRLVDRVDDLRDDLAVEELGRRDLPAVRGHAEQLADVREGLVELRPLFWSRFGRGGQHRRRDIRELRPERVAVRAHRIGRHAAALAPVRVELHHAAVENADVALAAGRLLECARAVGQLRDLRKRLLVAESPDVKCHCRLFRFCSFDYV